MTLTGVTAEINLDAISHNLALVKKLAPQSKVIAVIKANGYGHGALAVASALTHADSLGVARFSEAVALRDAGVEQTILLLEGFFKANELPYIAKHNIETVIHCEEQLNALSQVKLPKAITVWLKIDTGMTRLGISPEACSRYMTALSSNPNVKEIRLMSHFACADEKQATMNTLQQNGLQSLINTYSLQASLANSAAILSRPTSHLDWVRPGLILYGMSPIEGCRISQNGFQVAMTLKSHLIAVKPIKQGTTIGYGATWQAKQDTTIGVVAIGYGDGYPRHAKSGTPVWVNGRIVPLVGRVSMDMITVDLGNNAQDQNGDMVELWGQHVAIEKVAAYADTIPYELTCTLTTRVSRAYITDGKIVEIAS
ncbi:alanine racemase [Saccharobesus litoralis]|uniref:Alanine racemase n=1 Tax=Saccharobesus litoralis TaxID=2172099 RepID=A0A2S0VSP3_9ALTE|nr:alanine racemase [Saccharobesus litoralis]AWB67229.1 alanine racemase [Saccharobesus litoralis]